MLLELSLYSFLHNSDKYSDVTTFFYPCIYYKKDLRESNFHQTVHSITILNSNLFIYSEAFTDKMKAIQLSLFAALCLVFIGT